MNFTIIIMLIIIGLVAGMLSGVLGVGGGVIMVPLMILLLGFSQHEAQGTSLAVLAVPVTFVAAYTYSDSGYVNWKYAFIMAIFFVVGGYLGSKLAINIDQKILKRIFGAVLLVIAAKMIFDK
tara:strand:- start:74 stop:442 length:369 start_codon:yes stop_codon:yes gene_type:complete